MRFWLVLAVVSWAGTVWGQPGGGAIGAYFDEAGTLSMVRPPPFAPFSVFFIAKEIDSISGFEFSVELNEPTVTVISRNLPPHPCLLCFDTHNYIVGLGRCFDELGGSYMLLSYSLGFFSGVMPDDIPICVRPSTPSMLGVPSYVDCDGGVRPLSYAQRDMCGIHDDGCAVVNPSVEFENCVVGPGTKSWAAVKSLW